MNSLNCKTIDFAIYRTERSNVDSLYEGIKKFANETDWWENIANDESIRVSSFFSIVFHRSNHYK